MAARRAGAGCWLHTPAARPSSARAEPPRALGRWLASEIAGSAPLRNRTQRTPASSLDCRSGQAGVGGVVEKREPWGSWSRPGAAAAAPVYSHSAVSAIERNNALAQKPQSDTVSKATSAVRVVVGVAVVPGCLVHAGRCVQTNASTAARTHARSGSRVVPKPACMQSSYHGSRQRCVRERGARAQHRQPACPAAAAARRPPAVAAHIPSGPLGMDAMPYVGCMQLQTSMRWQRAESPRVTAALADAEHDYTRTRS